MTLARLFAYGTLRSDTGHPRHPALVGRATLMGRATVPGLLFDLGEYPALVSTPDSGDVVVGQVYEIAPESLTSVLQQLDAYEGIEDGPGCVAEFRREMVYATLDTGNTLRAWGYILNRPFEGLDGIPSGDFSLRIRGDRPASRSRSADPGYRQIK